MAKECRSAGPLPLVTKLDRSGEDESLDVFRIGDVPPAMSRERATRRYRWLEVIIEVGCPPVHQRVSETENFRLRVEWRQRDDHHRLLLSDS